MNDYLLIRHASAESGLAEARLTPRGRAEASALAQRLRNRPLAAAWCSDIARAAETAEILLEGREAPNLVTSPLLREVELPPEGLLSRDPEKYAAWEREVTAEVAARLSEWLRTAQEFPLPEGEAWTGQRADPRGEGSSGSGTRPTHVPSVLVVSHAGPLRVLICLLLGLPPEAQWSFRLDRASLSVVERGDDMGTLLLLNDRCHLGDVYDG